MAIRVHGVLVADTVETVTLTLPDPRDIDYVDGNGNPAVRSFPTVKINKVQIVNRNGDDEIFFTVNGDDPVIEADDNYAIPASICASVENIAPNEDGDFVVKMISHGTPTYSVSAAG